MLKNIDCGYNLCFEQKYEKYKNFYLIFISFFYGKIFSIFEQACFRNADRCIKTLKEDIFANLGVRSDKINHMRAYFSLPLLCHSHTVYRRKKEILFNQPTVQ